VSFYGNVETRSAARQATDDNILRCMSFACYITEATNTHSEYIIIFAFRGQEWLREGASL